MLHILVCAECNEILGFEMKVKSNVLKSDMFVNAPYLEKIQVVIYHEKHQKIHLSFGKSGTVHDSTGERSLHRHPVLDLRNKQQPWHVVRINTSVSIIMASLVYLYSMCIKAVLSTWS